jgi:hypothetical protein
MDGYYKARVISYPEAEDGDVHFWCMINGKMYRCHSKAEKGKKDLIFLLPGHALIIYNIIRMEVIVRECILICKNLYLDSTKIQIKRG